MYKINKLQGYIVQHKEYSQYFTITIIGISPLKSVNQFLDTQNLHSTSIIPLHTQTIYKFLTRKAGINISILWLKLKFRGL